MRSQYTKTSGLILRSLLWARALPNKPQIIAASPTHAAVISSPQLHMGSKLLQLMVIRMHQAMIKSGFSRMLLCTLECMLWIMLGMLWGMACTL